MIQSIFEDGELKLAKGRPLETAEGLSTPGFDREGRVLTVRYERFTLLNANFPNGQRDHACVPFKLGSCRGFQD